MGYPSEWEDDPDWTLRAEWAGEKRLWKTVLEWDRWEPEPPRPERPKVAEDPEKLRSLPYPEYLRTDHWRNVRRIALVRAAWHCRRCGVWDGFRPMSVHHLTYERLGEEDDGDLIAVCDYCHKAIHGINP